MYLPQAHPKINELGRCGVDVGLGIPRLALVVKVYPLRLWNVYDVSCMDEGLDGTVAVHVEAEVVESLAIIPQPQEDSDS
jgi:hypothetical protein